MFNLSPSLVDCVKLFAILDFLKTSNNSMYEEVSKAENTIYLKNKLALAFDIEINGGDSVTDTLTRIVGMLK